MKKEAVLLARTEGDRRSIGRSHQVPRLEFSRKDCMVVAAIFRGYLQDQSRIVKTFAMQGLADLAGPDPRLRNSIRPFIASLMRTGSPSMKNRGRKLLRGLFLSAGLLSIFLTSMLVGGPAQTATALDFSADRIITNEKSVVTAHVNAKDDRWRFEYTEPQRGASVVIVRMDKQHSWLILSKRRQYLEVPIATDHILTVTDKMEGEVSRELVGEEMLNGHPTELFEVTILENDETRQYYRWVTKAERFPIKTVSRHGKWSEEFRRVIFTEQSPFLFELPRRLDNANPTAGTPH